MTIHWRIFCVILAVMTVISLVNLGMNTFFAQRRALDTIENDLQVITDIADMLVSKEISLLISDAQTVAAAIGTQEGEDARRVLEEGMRRYDQFVAITLFSRTERLQYVGDAPTPVIRLGGIYLQRALGGDSVISTTRRDEGSGRLVMHVCVPVEGGRAMSVTIPGDHFSALLRGFTIWQSGSLYIIDSEGKILANRNDEFVAEQYNMIDVAEYRPEYTSVGRAFKTMILGGAGFVEYDLYGELRLCAYMPIRGSDFGWVLGASAPLSESPANRVQNGLLVATAFLLLFSVVVALGAASFLVKPFDLINEQNARLIELTENARASNDAKSQFLASMSHEIRTPMNAIIGMGELMRTDNFDETQRSYFADIRKMARSLLQIINDILDYSKIEAGRLELIPADYNFISLYDNILSLIGFMLEGKSVTLRHSVSDEIPHILFGDEVRVRQIITNLMSNAVKYTREGWIEMAMTRTHAVGEDYLEIRVADSGIGIRKEDLPKLFGAFEQVDARRNKDVVGTGLGLSITKQLVDMMGGEIRVESEYGKGSAFTVLLPIVEGNPDNVQIEGDGEQRAIASPDTRVLVVDDNEINLTVAVGFLERHGIYPVTAESGQKAIERVLQDKGQYDLIFMDHMMPEMDGIEATRHIRAFDGDYYKNVPIIALTANAMSGAREMFLEGGMNDFISKPISAFDMNAVLLKWLPPNKLLHRAMIEGTHERRRRNVDKFDQIIERLGTVNGLDTSLGLSRVDGNKSVYVNILRQLAKGAEKDVASLITFAEGRAWHDYVIRAHALKSVFANIGNPSLSGWAFKLEEAARSLDEELCVNETPAFCEAILRFRKDLPLRDLLDEAERREDRSPISLEQLMGALVSIEDICADCDTDALNDIMQALESSAYSDMADEKLAAMRELARSFEYDSVAAAARELREALVKNGEV